MRTNPKHAQAMFRKAAEELKQAGFAVVESVDANQMPKLTINVDEASLSIDLHDAGSKDIFGGDLKAAGPHTISFASRNDAMTTLKASQIADICSKKGCAKILIQVHATVLATAEASTPVGQIIPEAQWPTHGN